MSAIAYRRPLSEVNRHEFDSMDLRDTGQAVITCADCQAEYVLLYPAAATDDLVTQYKHEVTANMRRCEQHPSRMQFNF